MIIIMLGKDKGKIFNYKATSILFNDAFNIYIITDHSAIDSFKFYWIVLPPLQYIGYSFLRDL